MLAEKSLEILQFEWTPGLFDHMCASPQTVGFNGLPSSPIKMKSLFSPKITI